MSLIVKLIISLVIAVIAFVLTSIMLTGEVMLAGETIDLRLLIAFFVATTATALIVRDTAHPATDTGTQVAEGSTRRAPSSDADREYGTVKWFNVSKGFGFIVRENGEEIFVHFRSIRGEGRRGLRDGQEVSYVVTESDKGPQAEDVEGEN